MQIHHREASPGMTQDKFLATWPVLQDPYLFGVSSGPRPLYETIESYRHLNMVFVNVSIEGGDPESTASKICIHRPDHRA